MDADVENQKLGYLLRRALTSKTDMFSFMRTKADGSAVLIISGDVTLKPEEAEIVSKVFKSYKENDG